LTVLWLSFGNTGTPNIGSCTEMRVGKAGDILRVRRSGGTVFSN
jgi:hypothetical protein